MYEKLSINELRQRWSEVWNQVPNVRIGRVMLEKSLEYKTHIQLSSDVQERLNKLVNEYKNNPKYFAVRVTALKPGTKLVRVYQGEKHYVLVKTDGFEYRDKTYSSISKIANDITGSRWNGWVFFGLK